MITEDVPNLYRTVCQGSSRNNLRTKSPDECVESVLGIEEQDEVTRDAVSNTGLSQRAFFFKKMVKNIQKILFYNIN